MHCCSDHWLKFQSRLANTLHNSTFIGGGANQEGGFCADPGWVSRAEKANFGAGQMVSNKEKSRMEAETRMQWWAAPVERRVELCIGGHTH